MNDHSRQLLDSYYKDAASWNTDRLRSMRSSRRTAWLVAAAATGVAILEAGALILLMPLKTVEPYTLLVDKTTGYVQPLRPLERSRMAPDTALTQSFIVQYVTGRESFDVADVRASYRKVALLSADGARSTYLASMQPSNPASPLSKYPRGTIVETRVKSISPIASDTVLVRFDTIRTDVNGRPQEPAPWVSIVRYRYSAERMTLEDRFVNPLGFQVVHYHRNPEALPPSSREEAPAGISAAPVPVPSGAAGPASSAANQSFANAPGAAQTQ